MSDKFEHLRKRAESVYDPKLTELPELSKEEVHKIIHELNTSQIELDMQNEDLRNTQIELEKSRQRFINLYDYAPVGYLTLNSKKIIIEANLTACDMFGVEKYDMIGSDFTSYIVNEDQDIFYMLYNKLLDFGEKQSSKIRMKNKDNSIFYSQLDCVITPEIDGNTGQFRLIIHNITTLTVTSNTLNVLKKHLASIIESMPSSLVSVDPDCRIILCNKMAIMEAGVPEKKIVGQMFNVVFPHLTSVVNIISESIKNGEIKYKKNISYSKNNRIVYIDLTIYPLDDQCNKGAVIRIDDVTEKKRIEKILLHNDKMSSIGGLAAGIAHDFNNILTGIIGAAQLLKMPGIIIESEYLQYADIILKASKRATELTSKLLTFSCNNSSLKKNIDICEIVDDTVDLMKSSIDKRIIISVEKESNHCYIKGEKNELQNALINLVVNSSHSLGDSGYISINIAKKNIEKTKIKSYDFTIESGEYYEIAISDNGCGILDENIDKIFDPFYTTKEQGKGTGLGLSVVFGTVRSLKGFIDVESKIGSGTTFKLFFPVVYCDNNNCINNEHLIEGNGLILVVDDEEYIRTTTKYLLEDMGYKVLIANNGIEAVEMFKERYLDVDLVLMDMTMPKMNGYEAFYKMKAIDENCKIIIASGYIKDEKIENLFKDGLCDFINKPYNMSQLSTVLSKQLSIE